VLPQVQGSLQALEKTDWDQEKMSDHNQCDTCDAAARRVGKIYRNLNG
jgi:hypothetical protein|tara:strand:- start:133 stop:276 length:144 start_codon:yes stop_codon:yes gene_type:complete